MKSISKLWSLNKRNYLLLTVLLFIVISILIFGNLTQAYFHQDEWHSFSWMLQREQGGIADVFLQPFLTSSRPFAQLVLHSEFLIFGLNASLYYVIGIILHIVNSILVFLFINRLTKRFLISLIGALFFLLNPISWQAFSWPSLHGVDLSATVLALISLILFTKYIQNRAKKFYIWAFILFIFSLGCKESTFFLFFFFPILDYIWKSKNNRKFTSILKPHIPLLTLGFAGFLIKFTSILKSENYLLFLGGASEGFIPKIAYNIISYPLKAISQVFVYPSIVYKIAQKITEFKYPHLIEDLSFQQKTVSEYIIIAMSLILIGILIILYKYLLKERISKKIFITALSFIPLSVLPYVVLEQTTYLESRYYYLASIGAGLLFGLIVTKLFDLYKLHKKKTSWKKYILLSILLLLILYLCVNVKLIKQNINQLVEASINRKNIVNKIINTHSSLGSKTVFYTESDRTYYGQADSEKMLPFQSGFGQVLILNYITQDQLDRQFLRDYFLFDLLDQGYKEVGNQGFGYFRDYDQLQKAIEEYNLQPEEIYTYKWMNDRDFIDITNQIRTKITSGSYEPIIKKWIYGEQAENHENERWVYFDLNKGNDVHKQELPQARNTQGNIDSLSTVQNFKHDGWIGAQLNYYQTGNEKNNIYQLPLEVYDYEIVNIPNVLVNNQAADIDYKKTEQGWEISFYKIPTEEDVIQFILFVKVKKADILIDPYKDLTQHSLNDISSFTKTEILKYTVSENTHTLPIEAKGRINAIPKNPKGEYIIFIDGIPTPVKWEWGENNNKINITSSEELITGQKVKIPLSVEFNL